MRFLDIFHKRSGAPQKKCPACGRSYPDGTRFCPQDGATLEDGVADYQGFISYRRDGGSHTARLIKFMVEKYSDKRLFLDVDELGTGRFDDRLLRIIESVPSFILVLSPRCLDRCKNEDDWLKREILHALTSKRNIVPVFVDGFAFPDQEFLMSLPPPMRELPKYHAVEYRHEHAESAARKILRYMSEPNARQAEPVASDAVRGAAGGSQSMGKPVSPTPGIPAPVSTADRDAAMSRMAPALNRWPIKRWALPLLGTAVLLVAAFAGMRAMLRSQGPPRVPESQPAPSLAPAPVAPLAPGVARVRMMRIPAGTFSMGSDKGEENEKPVHQVTLKSFEMDVTEVTVAEYQTCVRAGRCRQADWGGPCNSGVSPVLGREQHPINCVDWNQAKVYCESVGKRLPTEEEWEYAARGADGRTYPWGNSPPRNQLCWNGEGTDVGKGKRFATCPVGSYPSGDSPFGLHDMAGNVWEWTASEYCDSYGSGKNCTPARVFRGGSAWADSPQYVRAALRNEYETKKHGGHLGFRCARTL
jgi:formylglycine-generating enzyme required for sulfatase activity